LNEKVSVIISARDEANSIGSLISRIKRSLSTYQYEIVVVDDGSKDNTKDIARSSSVMTLSHDRSLGKGAAMKSGAGSATGDIFVFLDGDGAHYPEDIPSVIAPILQNKADLIIGSRNFHGSEASGFYWPRRVANKLASFITSIIISFFLPIVTFLKCPMKWIKVADAESGFKAITRGNWHRLNLISQGFEIETEMIYEAARNKLAIAEVPISYNREGGTSSLSVLRDGWKTMKLLVRKLIGEVKGRQADACNQSS
jgi:glycosyltransferase involved in cell wall biosynthesis